MSDKREFTHGMFAIALLFIAIACACFVVRAHGAEFLEFHDPALDTINNNIGFLDADLNGNFHDFPSNQFQYHFDQGRDKLKTNLQTTVSKQMGGQAISENNIVTAGGFTNGGALAYGITNMFGEYGKNVGAIEGPTNFLNYGLESNAPRAAITFKVPVQPGHGPAGSSYFVGRWFTEEVDMDVGGLGDWDDPVLATNVRYAILGFVLIVQFYYWVGLMRNYFSETINQRQMEGTKQSVLGTNMSLATSLTFSFFVTAAILTLAGGLLAYSSNQILGQLTTPSGQSGVGGIARWQGYTIGWLRQIPFWQTFVAWVPAWNIITLYIYQRFAENFLLAPIWLAVRSIILWLPS